MKSFPLQQFLNKQLFISEMIVFSLWDNATWWSARVTKGHRQGRTASLACTRVWMVKKTQMEPPVVEVQDPGSVSSSHTVPSLFPRTQRLGFCDSLENCPPSPRPHPLSSPDDCWDFLLPTSPTPPPPTSQAPTSAAAEGEKRRVH